SSVPRCWIFPLPGTLEACRHNLRGQSLSDVTATLSRKRLLKQTLTNVFLDDSKPDEQPQRDGVAA
ncbi:MAG: hypothetical protein ACRELF_28050, partial [Gemmataceae bacterium]